MIFISYSSKDKDIAHQILAGLEGAGSKCWIAPRDILPGERYPTAIVRGISSASAMVIIISKQSAQSKHVLNEVEQAFSRGIPIVPVRVEDIVLGDELGYFLGLAQWFDILDGKFKPRTVELAAKLEMLSPGPAAAPDQPPAERPKSNTNLWPAIALVLAVGVGLAWWMLPNGKEPETDRALAKSTAILEASFPDAFTLSESLPNKAVSLETQLMPDKEIFHYGDQIKLAVSVDRPAWVMAILHASDGSKLLLFPNDFAEPRKLDAGERVVLGGEGSGFRYTASAPAGTDLVQILAAPDWDALVAFWNGSTALNGTALRELSVEAIEKGKEAISTRGITITESNETSQDVWGSALIPLHVREAE